MSKAWIAVGLGLMTMGCATERHVARAVSELEMRRLAVENALATRVTKVEQVAATALAVATEAKKEAQGKFVYDTVLGRETVSFDLGKARLGAEAEARLASLAAKLKADNRNLFLEIEGHTDSIGDARLNEAVGLKRAETVRTFLFSQGVALNRMATISFGETAPVGPNATEAGRAQNRRVVIVIKS
ncbi:MAG: OmpA family protein [Chakrabartia sp.]